MVVDSWGQTLPWIIIRIKSTFGPKYTILRVNTCVVILSIKLAYLIVHPKPRADCVPGMM